MFLQHTAFLLLLHTALRTSVAAWAQDTSALQSQVPWSRYAEAISRLYSPESGTPVWLQGSRVTGPGWAAINALRRAGEHGLDPRDYDAPVLDSLSRKFLKGRIERERFDVLLSIDFIRYLDDLQFGRLHPASLDRTGADSGIDLASAIKGAIAGDSIARLVEAAAPQLTQYRNLQRLLTRYRRLAADTSLRPIDVTSVVVTGDAFPDAVNLRHRLVALGDLDPTGNLDLAQRYTEHDAAGVRHYQMRHGLPPTGVLDQSTVGELNVPLSWRVRQIELALERLRWLPPLRQQRFLVVNVPAFQVFAFDAVGGAGSPVLNMPVIVGNALDARTPVLFGRMQYVEFRPYWNVPLSIVLKEILPAVRADSTYLERNGMEIISGRRIIGDRVTPTLFDSLARGKVQLRQRPGTGNPLGLVKFVLPNEASVYLHGTQRTDLFALQRRDLSHGCIRVADPTVLALWVLREQPRWDRARIEAAEQDSITSRVRLTRPMPVVVWYTTAVAAPDGEAWFYADIYGHDGALDRDLRGLGSTT
jgi:murein L,D-transpeptidase YcbB/YkuD